MGVRETIEKQKTFLMPFCIVGVLICGFFAWKSSHINDRPSAVSSAYYSDDDGNSYFADDIAKAFPFDHNGKQAYRAFVYTINDGKPFVGYLGRHAQAAAPAQAAPDARYKSNAPLTPLEIKKPGAGNWVLFSSPEGLSIVKSLSASGDLQVKLP